MIHPLFRLLALLAAVLLPLTAYSEPLQWASGGTIEYDVMRGENGLKLGQARHRWEHDGRRYRMETVVETTGLVGRLYSFRYVQTSEGDVVEQGLRPAKFSVEQNERETESATFDWDAKTVRIERRRDREDTHDISPGDQDVLSVWHLVALRNGQALPEALSLITNRRVSHALLEVIGRESLRLPIGQVDALRVRVRAASGRLAIDMWLSEQHQLLPVRLLIEDDEGEVLDQQAVSIEIDE